MRGVVGGSLFVACIGVINLASIIGIPARGDVVTDWNNAALDAIRAGRTAPPIASRSLAILHAAIYDAVNGIVRTHEPYLVPSSPCDAHKPIPGECIEFRCTSRRDPRHDFQQSAKNGGYYVGRIRRQPNSRCAGE